VASSEIMPDTNRLEQDHRGVKGRKCCLRGFKSHDAADGVCREHGELYNPCVPAAVTTRSFPPHSDGPASPNATRLHARSCRTREQADVLQRLRCVWGKR
jgi:hypothetical protein